MNIFLYRRSMKSRPLVAFVIRILLASIVVVVCNAAEGDHRRGRGTAAVGIRLELHPWTSPTATQLRLDMAGNAERWQLTPTALVVESIHRSTLPPTTTATLLAAPPFADIPPSIGAEEGDLLTLELALEDGSLQQVQTFRHRLTPESNAWIDKLLSASESWPEAELAAAYLRAEPISEERLAAIRRRGLIEPRSLDELPSVLRSSALAAIETPYRFLAVEPEIHEALRPLAQHGAELLMTREGRGFTLTPYRRREP